MNIHEHQAKDILREFEAPVPKGVVVYNIKEIDQKIKILNTNNFVIKAQIHAGGRGKAGGIKLVKTNDDLIKEATSMLGKTLITKQTGPRGKIVKRLYIEEVSKIKKEFYLSCLVDRASAKIAFISSTEGGVDIEKVAKDNPEKIITTKIDLTNEVNESNVGKIIKIFQLDQRQKIQAQDQNKQYLQGLKSSNKPQLFLLLNVDRGYRLAQIQAHEHRRTILAMVVL